MWAERIITTSITITLPFYKTRVFVTSFGGKKSSHQPVALPLWHSWVVLSLTYMRSPIGNVSINCSIAINSMTSSTSLHSFTTFLSNHVLKLLVSPYFKLSECRCWHDNANTYIITNILHLHSACCALPASWGASLHTHIITSILHLHSGKGLLCLTVWAEVQVCILTVPWLPCSLEHSQIDLNVLGLI